MTMKLYVNRAPVRGPWGGGNMFVKALFKYAEKFDVEIISPQDHNTAPDAALLIGLETDQQTLGAGLQQLVQYKMFQSQFGINVPLFLRVNENDARKGTNHVDANWRTASRYIDGTIFVSEYIKDYFTRNDGWACKQTTVVRNGVDRDVFRCQDAIDNDKNNIVTHHWSNHELKGFDIYNQLDEWIGQNPGFTFTYIGRDRGTFKNTKVIKPLYGKALGNELGRYDVYVSASRAEPGPNHVLEAIACDMPTFVRRDGGAGPEFVGNDECLLYDSFEELVEKLTAGSWTVPSKDTLIDWQTCIERYCEFIKAVTSGNADHT